MENEQPEQSLPQFSREEFDLFRNANVDDPQLLAMMEARGIQFNSGDLEIMVDGEPLTVTTKKDDFGTVVDTKGRFRPAA